MWWAGSTHPVRLHSLCAAWPSNASWTAQFTLFEFQSQIQKKWRLKKKMWTRDVTQSQSEPDSKQKTETEVTFYSVLLDFILVRSGFQTENRNRGLYQSHLKCDRLWPIMTKTRFAKKNFWKPGWPISTGMTDVTDCDRHKCHIRSSRLKWLVQIPFLFLFEIPMGPALTVQVRRFWEGPYTTKAYKQYRYLKIIGILKVP